MTGVPFISKSKFLWGLQCPKLVWTAYNAKHLIPEPDAAQQAVFDQGHEVGALAKALYPEGIEIGEGVLDLEETVHLTDKALNLRRPLFEAAFKFQGGYCRVDILVPRRTYEWDIVEVKSTTSVKDVHLHDLAFQAWVLTSAGNRIQRCSILHINPDFVGSGPVDPKQFFLRQDLKEPVFQRTRSIDDQLAEMFQVIRQKSCPEVQIGPHCDDPYTCPLHDQCWAFLPENKVLDLYRGTKKGFELLGRGITDLKDIDDGVSLTDNQEIQVRAARSGKPHVDRAALKAFLSQLQYPLSFLDFETFGTAIPLFDGLKPYQQVPFQFSLHVVRGKGQEPAHHAFLAGGTNDPRPEFMKRLRAILPETGSVVAYNAPFELGRLEECCAALPEFKPWLRGVEKRVVDLLLPFRGFRYYHPAQSGSASMKAVLPALTGQGYGDLAIQEGNTASLEFLRVTYGDVEEADRQKVRRQLEAYCGRDTEGMVRIVDSLKLTTLKSTG